MRFPCVLAILALTFLVPRPATAQSPEPGAEPKEILIHLLPKKTEIPQLKGHSVPEFYEPQNLFDYINGQADMYLDYGFQLLITREYAAKEDSILTVEIYRMESPRHAFGIYAAERTPEDKAVDLGGEGFLGANILAFWKGPYYCRILFYQMSPELDPVLRKTGRLIAEKIPGSYSMPELFSVFPSESRVKGSERFIPRNFLGQRYLKNGYRADFEKGGRGYQVFLLEAGSKEEAQESYSRFQEFLRDEHATLSPFRKGEVDMIWARGESDKFLFHYGSFWGGVLDEKDPVVAEQAIRAMVDKLKARGF